MLDSVGMGRRLVGAVVVLACTLGDSRRTSELPRPHVDDAVPGAEDVTVRVGDRVRFAVAAEGAVAFRWMVGDSERSSDAAWSFAPGPEDVGERLVSVAVLGESSQPTVRTWFVTVSPLTSPELVDVVPTPGPITLAANAAATFRCHARLPSGRGADRLHFSWMLDGRPAHAEDRRGSDAVSEFPLATAEPGIYELKLRVQANANGRAATTLTWKVEIAPSTAPPVMVAHADDQDPPAPPDDTAAAPDVVPVAARLESSPTRPPEGADLEAPAHAGDAILERVELD